VIFASICGFVFFRAARATLMTNPGSPRSRSSPSLALFFLDPSPSAIACVLCGALPFPFNCPTHRVAPSSLQSSQFPPGFDLGSSSSTTVLSRYFFLSRTLFLFRGNLPLLTRPLGLAAVNRLCGFSPPPVIFRTKP